jgi:hypothetical protein
MPETYNPRDRSFIKNPEIKNCVTCGQPIMPTIKPINNHMSSYVNDISGNTVIINSNEPFVTVQGVKLRRSDLPKEDTKKEEVKLVAKPVISTPTK